MGQSIRPDGRRPCIGAWDDFAEYASWPILVERPGKYQLTAWLSSPRTESKFVVEAGGQTLTGKAPKTDSWDAFVNMKLGTLEFQSPGKGAISIRPAGDAKNWKAMNLASVTLKAVK